ncbi:MAG: energy transducer TonB [Saprospiraceae bacterium]
MKNLTFQKLLFLFSCIFILSVFFSCQDTQKSRQEKSRKALENIFPQPDTPVSYAGCEQLEDLEERIKCNSKKEKALITQHFRYPERLKNINQEGSIPVSFKITNTGEVTDIKVIRAFDEECAQIAKNIVENFPNYIPAKKNGQNVASDYSINVNFKLPKEEKFEVVATVLRGNDFSYGISMEEAPLFGDCDKLNDQAEKEECSAKNIYTFLQNTLGLPITPNMSEGVSQIEFVVRKDGSVGNIKGGKFHREAMLEAIYKMPKWTPGKANGKPVNVNFKIIYPYLNKDLKNIKPDFSKLEKMKGYIKNKKPIRFPNRRACYVGCEDLKTKKEINQCTEQKLKEFFKKNLVYPESAKAKKVKGIVELTCSIDAFGKIKGIRISKDIGEGCGNAAKEVVAKIPKMNPMLVLGNPTSVNGFIVNVEFNQ